MTDQVSDAWDKVACPKCKGKGKIFAFRHKLNEGKCFMCEGSCYITKEQYDKIMSADPEGDRARMMLRIYALPVFYKDDPRIKARGMHPMFSIEPLRKEDGIENSHVDDVIAHLMRHYKNDPRSEEAKHGGRTYAYECFKLAKQDGILRDLLIPPQEEPEEVVETAEIGENRVSSVVIPEFEDSLDSGLLLDEDEVLL